MVYFFLKDMYSSSPEGPNSAVGSAHGGKERRRAALLNSKCPQPCGRGGGGGQKPTRGGDIRGPVPGELLCLVGTGQAPRPSQPQHGQATAQERTNLGRSRVRGSPGKPLIVHGKANRAHSPGHGKHGDPRAALQDGVQLYPGVRCW